MGDRRLVMFGAATGAAFAVLELLAGFIYPQQPRVDGPPATTAAWAAAHKTALQTGMIFGLLAAGLLVWFAGHLYSQMRPIQRGQATVAPMVLAGGVAAAAVVSIAAVPLALLAFMVGELAQVIADDDSFVQPGSDVVGRAAFGGPMPDGYYKDEKKTAETFRTINGKRWSVPGDFATVEADGTMHLLGRGSVCINTAGEKVFVEEVEEALKRHPAVRDAAVVGLPDPRFGETICALVELKLDGEAPDPQALTQFVRGQLADYKAPRKVVFVDSVGRAPNGKLDYKAVKATAVERTGMTAA